MSAPSAEKDVLAFTEGDRLTVVTRSSCGDASIDENAAKPGEFRVFWAVEAGKGDDADERAYYLLDNEHSAGGAFWAYPEHVIPPAEGDAGVTA